MRRVLYQLLVLLVVATNKRKGLQINRVTETALTSSAKMCMRAQAHSFSPVVRHKETQRWHRIPESGKQISHRKLSHFNSVARTLGGGGNMHRIGL